MPKTQKNGTRNVVLLGIASFLNDLSSEMILPILPLIITGVGGGGIALGLIGGFRDSAAEFLKVFFGRWSDRIKNRKFFIYSGYITSAFFKLFLIIAKTWFVIFSLVGFERLGKALRTAPRDALITSAMPKNVGKGFGIHRAFDTLGAILGSLVSFLLIWKIGLSTQTIILISATISFISIVPLKFVSEKKAPTHRRSIERNHTHLPLSFILFTVCASIFSFSQISYMFFFVHAQTGLPVASPILASMLLYVLFNIFYTLGAIPFGILSDAIGRWKLLLSGYVLFATTMFSFAYAETPIMFVVSFILYGIALAITKVTHKAFAADLAPENIKATALGTFETITGLCIFATGLIAGISWEALGHHLVFIGAGICACMASVLLLVLKSKITQQ
jgi:MFS family permease